LNSLHESDSWIIKKRTRVSFFFSFKELVAYAVVMLKLHCTAHRTSGAWALSKKETISL